MNTSVKTIKVISTTNGKSVWKFCTTSDGHYIARKNGWQDIKSFKTFKQMIYQANKWLGYTNDAGEPVFVAGYPKKQEAAAPAPTHQETLSAEAAATL